MCRGGEYENTGAEVSEMRVYTIIHPYKPDIHTILLVCIPPFMTHTFIPIHLHLHSSHSLTHSLTRTHIRTHALAHTHIKYSYAYASISIFTRWEVAQAGQDHTCALHSSLARTLPCNMHLHFRQRTVREFYIVIGRSQQAATSL